ncbi:MAG: DUF3570 domain-containing protein [Verrucomicrobia bacterium]|nr:DUF3570 domain-containing protein [Verrucomicrobiota bacterium]
MFPYTNLLPKSWRQLAIIAIIHVYLCSVALSETVVETRYQYYQEGDGRIRVNSDYSLFRVDLSDTVQLDGTLLYSSISGASPTGLPPNYPGGPVPVVKLTDTRYAGTLNITAPISNHTLKAGFSYSYESDYTSVGGSITDSISLNQKNTDLVLGFAYTNDTVGANGTNFRAKKRSYDFMVGLNQVLGPNTTLNANFGVGMKQGYLSDPYKRVLLNGDVYYDNRPGRKLEELIYLQLTHYFEGIDTSMELSYRFGNNDHGSHSNMGMIAFYKPLFDKRLIVSPSFRYYRQTAADYYNIEFYGNPQYYSADYRVSAEETFNLGLQLRWWIVRDKFAVDLGYERFISRGLDGRTSQSAYPDANSVTIGVHASF